ncbi:MAG: outer membrane lipoprotein carrier protein LolA [Aquifex sp.]|nr:MAG: outer membrane lipoprotein carrier protein LolA [Aquifex sp.]
MRLFGLLFVLITFALGSEFEELKKLLENTQTIKVSFEQKVVYDWYPKPDISKGVFYAKRGGKFRVDYFTPDRITILSDGKKVYLINYEEKTVYVEDFKKNTSPIIGSLFILSEPIDEVFKYLGKTEEKGITVLILKPKKQDNNITLVKVYLNSDGEILRLKTYDSQGAEITIEFIEVKRNFKPREELFKIKFPDGFRIVRYG